MSSGDGVEQASAVADRRDAQLAQILGCQPAQHLPVNVVVAERGRVLFEPETAQPPTYIHWSRPKPASRAFTTAPVWHFVQTGLKDTLGTRSIAAKPAQARGPATRAHSADRLEL